MTSVDVAAVVNLHDEGSAAVPSLVSAWRAVEEARARGVRAQLTLLLDSPDDATRSVAEAWALRGATVYEVDERDLGAARNAAVQMVDATWVAFLDGDDLWSQNWLREAHREAVDVSEPLQVWHPAINVIFGGARSLLHHRDSTDPEFSWARLRLHNCWTALSFARRVDLLAVPYPRNDLAEGFGFEDWSWNVEILRRGGRHRVVSDTCHLIRRTASPPGDAGSLLARSQAALRVPYPRDSSEESVGLAGAAALSLAQAVHDATPVDDHLPPTHRELPVELSPELYRQIRLAGGIEPDVARTVRGPGSPRTLPQNTNTHVTVEQRALEELDLVDRAGLASIAELLEAAPMLAALADDARARVGAAVILDPANASMPLGDGSRMAEVLDVYPQLRVRR